MATKRQVPIDLHPGVFRSRIGFEDIDADDSALNTANRAFTCLSQTLEEVFKREQVIRADTTRTADDQLMRVSRLAEKHMTGPGARMDVAHKAVEQQIASTSDEISRGLRSRMDPADAREIREHVRNLDDVKRRAFLARADSESIAAVLSGKAFLSGMTDAEAALVRSQQFPNETKRLRKLEAARDNLQEGWTRYLSHLTALRDQKAGKLATNADAADHAITAPIEVE